MAQRHVSAAQRLAELQGDLDRYAERDARPSVDVVRHMLRDLAGCAASDARAAYSDGMNLGARVEHKAAVAAIAEAALHVLGQDRGDGATDLGRLGEWVAGSGSDRAFKV
jgi:hypothetical protein